MESGYFHQLLASLSAGFSLASCFFVMNFAVFGVPAMEQDEKFDITPDQAILMGSLVPFMGIIGNILAGILVDYLGRKNTMVIGSSLHITGCVIVAVAATATQALIGRAFNGVAFSLIQIPSMIYGAEVMHPSVRHRLNGALGLLATTGSMLPFLIRNSFGWRGLAWCEVLIISPVVGLLVVLPESPVFLIKNGKIDDAKASLEWFRSSSTEATKELKDLEESIRASESSSVDPKTMFKPPYRSPLAVSILLLSAQQFTGITVLISYIGSITTSLGLEWSQSMSIVMVAINIGGNFVSAEVNQRFDRKPTLLVSSAICAALQITIGCIFWLKDTDSDLGNFINNNSYLALIFLFIFFAVFGVGVGPIPYIYIGEGIPTKIRGPASAFCFTINTLLVGLCLQVYKPFVNSFGYHTLFFSFGISSALIVSFIYPKMLETRGKTVSEIDDYYNNLEKKKEL